MLHTVYTKVIRHPALFYMESYTGHSPYLTLLGGTAYAAAKTTARAWTIYDIYDKCWTLIMVALKQNAMN